MKKLTIILALFLFFLLGFIAGGNGHVYVIKDDGSICAEIK